jgi:hypothetical protein
LRSFVLHRRIPGFQSRFPAVHKLLIGALRAWRTDVGRLTGSQQVILLPALCRRLTGGPHHPVQMHGDERQRGAQRRRRSSSRRPPRTKDGEPLRERRRRRQRASERRVSCA